MKIIMVLQEIKDRILDFISIRKLKKMAMRLFYVLQDLQERAKHH